MILINFAEFLIIFYYNIMAMYSSYCVPGRCLQSSLHPLKHYFDVRHYRCLKGSTLVVKMVEDRSSPFQKVHSLVNHSLTFPVVQD